MRDDSTPARAQNLRTALAAIVEDWPLINFPMADESAELSHSPFGPQLPVAAAVLAAKRRARDVLSAWCRAVAFAREMPATPTTVPGSATWLSKHADWMAENWPEEFTGRDVEKPTRPLEHDEIGRVSRELHGLAHPSGRKVFPCAPCPLHLGESGPALIAELQGDPARDSLPSVITCSENLEHTWSPERWLLLRRLVEDRAAQRLVEQHAEEREARVP